MYIFENEDNLASVIYDGESLTEEQKNMSVILESIPDPEIITGKVAVLKCEKATERVWYDYVCEPPAPAPTDPQPSTDEIIRANYLETQYQTVLLEMQSGM